MTAEQQFSLHYGWGLLGLAGLCFLASWLGYVWDRFVRRLVARQAKRWAAEREWRL